MPTDFRAIRFHEYGSSDRLVLEPVPKARLQPDEVLVEVRYAGVNPIDWKLRSGRIKQYMPIPLPYTPGLDASGVVTELGSSVKGFSKGQDVFGIVKGSYAEYAIADASDLAEKPAGVTFQEAAAVPVGALTAWQALEDAGVRAGQTVVVLGAAGGVGSFAVQLAKAWGAVVIGTASAKNLGFVRSLGADQAVDYAAELPASAREADVVVDLVGGETLERAYALAKRGGILVTVAGQASEEKAKERGIKVLHSGRGPSKHLSELAELLAKGRLHAEVGTIFPLDRAGAAQDLSETGHGRGRILLKVRD